MSATGNGGGGGDTGAVVVPIKVEADGSSLDAMRAKLKGAEEQLASLQAMAKFSTAVDIEVGDAQRNVKALTADIRGLERAEKDAEKAAAQAAKTRAAEQAKANKLAVTGYKYQKAAEAGEKVEDGGKSLTIGSFAALDAAEAIGKAGLSLAKAGVDLVASGIRYGIENTAQRQKNQAVLDKLTRGQGAEAEEFSKSLAAETGVGEDKAMERVKALIQAKFNKEDTGAIFRASADIGEVKGEAKAELFLKTLEKVQFEGAATTRSLEALKGAGVDKGDLLAGLAKAGETTEQVEARLKAGKVAADEFARAAAAVVQKDIGGVAGKGLDAMVNRLKIGFGDLFDGLDLSPLEELGDLLNKALTGEDGAKLKGSLTEAGDAVLKLAKNITAEDIKGAITGIASAATAMAKAIGDAADYAHELSISWKELTGANAAEGEDIERQIKLQTDKAQIRFEKEQKAKAMAEEAAKAAALAAEAGDKGGGPAAPPSGKEAAGAGGYASGKALADGMAKGIDDNAGKPATAAADMIAKTLAAADAKAKIHSPSREMIQRGDYIDQGLAGGIDDNADKPAAAATRMMGRVVRAGERGPEGGIAAASGGIGASSFAAAGGGATYHFSPVVTLTGDGGGLTRADVDRALLAAYPGFLAMLRQSQRDSQENRLPMVSA